jgi:O-methyltransferase involved in polyketide biosynthesis
MVPNAPSQTAEAVCLMRATERRRPPDERILDDPYAKLFLSRLARAALVSWEASGKLGNFAERLSPGVATYVLTRHRFIDDCLRTALAGDESAGKPDADPQLQARIAPAFENGSDCRPKGTSGAQQYL